MPLPVTFAQLAQGDNPASLLDTQFNAVAGFVIIPCAATGQNVIELEPFADAPVVNAYTDLAPVFTFVAAQTNTGNVTINVSGLGEAPAFKANGSVPVAAGDLAQGLAYQAAWLSSLNGGAGGFIVNTPGPGTSPPIPPFPPGDIQMITMQYFASSGIYVPPPNLLAVIVEGVGGGGGGGGALADGTNGLGGGGGGAAGYFKCSLTPAQIGASQPVTIGVGGASEAAGGPTLFGSYATASGGGAGVRNTGSGATSGNPGGGGTAILVAVGGVAFQGDWGEWGKAIFPAATGQEKIIFGGKGGIPAYGGISVQSAIGTTLGSGSNGVNAVYGAGGSGGVSFAAAGGTIFAGGNGGNGWVLVTSYS